LELLQGQQLGMSWPNYSQEGCRGGRSARQEKPGSPCRANDDYGANEGKELSTLRGRHIHRYVVRCISFEAVEKPFARYSSGDDKQPLEESFLRTK
jgi:hypothetical protein